MDRAALSRATDSSDSPTPGYLYLDIAKSAATSPKACQETVQYLLKRLAGTKNANIKFKCLKVIAKESENPATRGQFQRSVCLTTDLVMAIKDATQFRGPPDPVRGDAPYVRVRDAAKECLSAIYSDSNPSEQGLSGGAGLGTNYGAPVSGPAGMPSSTGSKMQGIGNPMFPDPRLQQSAERGIGQLTIGEMVGTVGETVINMIKDPLAKNVPDPRSGIMPTPGGMPGFGSASQVSWNKMIKWRIKGWKKKIFVHFGFLHF